MSQPVCRRESLGETGTKGEDEQKRGRGQVEAGHRGRERVGEKNPEGSLDRTLGYWA